MQVEHVGGHPGLFFDFVAALFEVLDHPVPGLQQRIDLGLFVRFGGDVDHPVEVFLHDAGLGVHLFDLDHFADGDHHPFSVHQIELIELTFERFYIFGPEKLGPRIEYLEDLDLIRFVGRIFVGHSHSLKGQIDNLVNLIDTESAAGDLLFVGDEFVLFIDLIGHNIHIHQFWRLFQNHRHLFGEFADLFEIVTGHLHNNRRQSRRSCRLFHKLDYTAGDHRFTGLLDDGAKPVDHHVGGLVPFMFVGQVDGDLGKVFAVFHPRAFDQACIVERNPHPGIDLHVGDLRFLFEMVHNALAYRLGLLDRTAGGSLDIDGEGVVTFPGKHLGLDDFGRQHHHRCRQGDQGQKDHQRFFALTLQNSIDEVLKFFHL